MKDDEVREKLAREAWLHGIAHDHSFAFARALLPVVREIAAEELREAAAELHLNISGRQGLRDRADALTKPPDGPVR